MSPASEPPQRGQAGAPALAECRLAAARRARRRQGLCLDTLDLLLEETRRTRVGWVPMMARVDGLRCGQGRPCRLLTESVKPDRARRSPRRPSRGGGVAVTVASGWPTVAAGPAPEGSARAGHAREAGFPSATRGAPRQ